MNLTFHLIVCGVLAVIVIALFLYHRWLENHEDHYIHLHDDAHDSSVITAQGAIGKRLEIVDKLKNGLLIAVILYALAIAGMAIYGAWNNPGGS
ncbi:MAG: hypothetical protein JO033_21455 [Acidobacteriaceae bacterium]|nr:hypothetical protein [Acidobacteriaceae bacterium]MBV9501263.1 hypothetical protein [Acidobacteriaceae bacterium]